MRFLLWVIVPVLLLSACISNRKAVKYFDKHIGRAASYCSMRFPIKDSAYVIIIDSTDTLNENNIPVSGAFRVDCDSIVAAFKQLNRPAIIYDTCPPTKIINHWHVKDSIRIIIDTARIVIAKDTIAAQMKTISLLNKQADSLKTYRKWFWILLAYLLIRLVIKSGWPTVGKWLP